MREVTGGELGEEGVPHSRMGWGGQRSRLFSTRNRLRSRPVLALGSRASAPGSPSPTPRGCGPFKGGWGRGAGRVVSVSSAHAALPELGRPASPRVPADECPRGQAGLAPWVGGVPRGTNPSWTAGQERLDHEARDPGVATPGLLWLISGPAGPGHLAPESPRARSPAPGELAPPRGPPGPCSPGAAAEPELGLDRDCARARAEHGSGLGAAGRGLGGAADPLRRLAAHRARLAAAVCPRLVPAAGARGPEPGTRLRRPAGGLPAGGRVALAAPAAGRSGGRPGGARRPGPPGVTFRLQVFPGELAAGLGASAQRAGLQGWGELDRSTSGVPSLSLSFQGWHCSLILGEGGDPLGNLLASLPFRGRRKGCR